MIELGQTVYMLDPWFKNPVKGKVVSIGNNGCTIEDAGLIRYYGEWSRCYTNTDLFEPPRNPDGSKYKW